MSEVFGSKTGKQGSQSAGPQTTRTSGKSSGANHYIEIDNDSGEMNITLPPKFAKYKEELFEDLMQEFFLSNPDDSTLGSIGEYIDAWLERKKASEG